MTRLLYIIINNKADFDPTRKRYFTTWRSTVSNLMCRLTFLIYYISSPYIISMCILPKTCKHWKFGVYVQVCLTTIRFLYYFREKQLSSIRMVITHPQVDTISIHTTILSIMFMVMFIPYIGCILRIATSDPIKICVITCTYSIVFPVIKVTLPIYLKDKKCV